MINEYISLSTKGRFNRSLRHIRVVGQLSEEMTRGKNLGRWVWDQEKSGELIQEQFQPILSAVLVDRLGYHALAFNLQRGVDSLLPLQEEVVRWGGVDLVVGYHDPQLGLKVFDPKDEELCKEVGALGRYALTVLYAKDASGRRSGEEDAARARELKALQALKALFNGGAVDTKALRVGAPAEKVSAGKAPAMQAQEGGAAKAKAPAGFSLRARESTLKVNDLSATVPGSTKVDAPQANAEGAEGLGGKTPQVAEGGLRTTPAYSVQVSNELFHNGNVEAWKNIIESYEAAFPQCAVNISHNGEKINNINALFKWGKVKNGDVILFWLVGSNFKGVSKLQRYLYEGASIRFERYLKKDVNKRLNLFG